MLGKKLLNSGYNGTTLSMMRKVCLKLKTILTFKSEDQEAIEKLSDNVLGCLWGSGKDKMCMNFSFNPSCRKKGVKQNTI